MVNMALKRIFENTFTYLVDGLQISVMTGLMLPSLWIFSAQPIEGERAKRVPE